MRSLVFLEVAATLEVIGSPPRMSLAPSADALAMSVGPLENDVCENRRAMEARCEHGA